MLRAGTFLSNRYEIISQIGSGGMSDVYKAVDHKLNREVAIKVLKSEFSKDQNFVSKFRMEAQNAAKLSHPNIVNVYDVGEDQGVHYIVMELIKGITLKKYIERKKKLEIRESIEVAMQVARGIEAAHNQHIIHRDIKPQNIMISMEGKVKVTDFGIARAVSSQTISSNAMGSVHYISPEQARGGYCDEKSDIYSLGITFYEMLTGRVPFDGDSTVAVALLHIQGDIVPPRQYESLIPVSLEKIIMKCTQKKPELRYASATELIDDLKKSLTMPNEDFVRIATYNNNGATTVISDSEVDEIRRRQDESEYSNREREDYYDDYDDYDDDYDDYEDYDDDYDDEDDYTRGRNRNRMERTIYAAILGVSLIIIVLVFILLFRGCGSGGNDTETEASSSVATEQVAMVSLLGMTREEAIDTLTQMNLGCIIETGTSDDYEEGEVYEQEYKVGEMIPVGTEVKIKISVGKDSITIPSNLAGKSESEVRAILEEAGITVAAEVETRYSDDIDEGKVIDTNPAMGSKVTSGMSVSIIISDGPEIVQVRVPSLEGLTEEAAIDRLEENDLTVGSITYRNSNDVEEGKVISQSIDAGEMVDENTAVSFVVSEGPDTVEVPDVRYDSLSDAKAALQAAGLSIGSVSEEYDDDSSKGLVIGQSISPYRTVQRGTSVDLTVSKGASPDNTTSPTEPESPTSADGYGDGGDPDDVP